MRYARNTAVRVLPQAPFHAGRFGVIDFYGEGPSKDTVVLVDPTKSKTGVQCMFAVHVLDITRMTEQDLHDLIHFILLTQKSGSKVVRNLGETALKELKEICQ